jgi:hypothetical protein
MKIGCYVQGTADEAVVRGLAKRWCPGAKLAPSKFRGESGVSFRREIARALRDLRDNRRCDYLVVLTDSDKRSWREVKRREWEHVPDDCRHLCVFGVADRNIECWLAANRDAIARELGCSADEIPKEDPSGFVKRAFGLGGRDAGRESAKKRVVHFVIGAPLWSWIDQSESFQDFYKDVRALAARGECRVPNELERE